MSYTTVHGVNITGVEDYDTFYSQSDLLAVGVPYSDVRQDERLSTYKLNLQRYQGINPLVELSLDNTYPDYRRVKNGIPLMSTVNLNLYQKITNKWTDLLFGEAPDIEVPEGQEDYLQDLLKRSGLLEQAKKVQTCASYTGNGVYKIIWDSEAKTARVVNQMPNAWTPIVNPANPEEITQHVIHWTYKVPQTASLVEKVIDYVKNIMFFGVKLEDRYTVYLQAEIYNKGTVENKLFKLGTWGEFTKTVYGLAQEVELPEGVEPVVETGIDDFLIYSIPNIDLPGSVYGLDDYTNVASIIDNMSMVTTKLVHDIKHQGNILETSTVNQSKVEQGLFDIVSGVLFRASNDTPATTKLTWDVQHQAVLETLTKLMEYFYLMSDLNPALFGDIKQGFADSGIAIKRLMANTLQTASEKAQAQKNAIEWALRTASKLEVLNGVKGAVELEPIVTFQDGLINDMNEIITQAVEMKQAGLMSQKKAVAMVQSLNGSALDEEINEINSDVDVFGNIDPPPNE